MNKSSYSSRLRSAKKESLENRVSRPSTERRTKAPAAAKKKRWVREKTAVTLYRGLFVQRPAVVDLRSELEKRDAEIEALKQQLRVCRAEFDALRRELRVCTEAHAESQATHRVLVKTHSTVSSATASTTSQNQENQDQNHPDLPFTPPTAELLDSLVIQSGGRPDRLGCLLFRTVVTQDVYENWTFTTNWDGSRGKRGLPVNLRQFLMVTVAQKFPFLTSSDRKRVKDRVNEFLRSPRNTVAHRRLHY
ncbi:uncharacterized protein Hap1MRO34_013535 [Clarias gariepinus]